MDTDISFGNWVRHRRKRRDLKQQALVDRVGCSLTVQCEPVRGLAAFVSHKRAWGASLDWMREWQIRFPKSAIR